MVGERGVSTGPWDAENICGEKNRIEDKPVELHRKKMEAPHGVLVLLKQVPNNSTFNWKKFFMLYFLMNMFS